MVPRDRETTDRDHLTDLNPTEASSRDNANADCRYSVTQLNVRDRLNLLENSTLPGTSKGYCSSSQRP